MRSKAPGPVVLAIAVVLALAACDSAPVSPSPSPSSAPTATPTPTPIATARVLSEAEIVEAIGFRTEVGLRADRAWVLAVAADPTASADAYGVLLLPRELAELRARPLNAFAVVPLVRAYAVDHVDTYAGMFIDDRAGGRLVALFTGDPEPHRLALRRLVRPDAYLEIRTADFPLAELEALVQRLEAARAELEAVGLPMTSFAVDVDANRVRVVIASADPEAPAAIAERVAAGDMLLPDWDRAFLSSLPRGSLRGRAVDAAGNGVAGLYVSAIGDLGRIEPADGEGHFTAEDGTFGYDEDLAAMGWTIELELPVPGDGYVVVGSAHVVVVGGQETYVEILVTPPG